jgi:PBP1b-binding outer membrane lipoprotein LpoB
LLNKVKSLIICLIIAVFLAGCAGKAVKDESSGSKTTAKKGFFTWSPSDTDLLGEALSCLNNKENAPDYSAAKEKLELLLQQYPKSKWAGGARGLIQSIDTILALQTKVTQAHADNAKIVKENEQLKNDIALLKKLEIQLEKREKMLK